MSISYSDNDFIGFTYGGTRNTDLNFIRVSDGSRYNKKMTPTIQDKTVQVPGGDGTYFFNSFYTQTDIPVQIAFDSMTEENMRDFKRVFDGKSIKPLIFFEEPYKKYFAKVKSAPELKWICFEKDGARVYKGEGTINFVCYDPYAHQVHKFLSEYDDDNIDQWKDASGMRPNKAFSVTGNYDEYLINNKQIFLYNPGDMAVDYKLFVPFITDENSKVIKFEDSDQSKIKLFELSKLTKIDNAEKGIVIDTKAQNIFGYKEDNNIKNITSNIYNDQFSYLDFSKIPQYTKAPNNYFRIGFTNVLNSSSKDHWNFTEETGYPSIEYDYLYI